jgi:hypothetical protein
MTLVVDATGSRSSGFSPARYVTVLASTMHPRPRVELRWLTALLLGRAPVLHGQGREGEHDGLDPASSRVLTGSCSKQGRHVALRQERVPG